MKRSLGIRAITIALVASFGCSDDDGLIAVEVDAGTEAGAPSTAETTNTQTSANESSSVSPIQDTTSGDDGTINATLGTDTTTEAEVDSTTGLTSTTGGDVASTTGGDVASTTGGDVASTTGGDVASTTGGDVASTTGGDVASTTGGDVASTTGGGGETTPTSEATATTGGVATEGTSTGGEVPTSGPGETSTVTDVFSDTSTGGFVDTSTSGYGYTTTGMTLDTGVFTYGDSDAGADAGTSSDVMTSIGVDAGSPCVYSEDCTMPSNPCMAVGCHDGTCMEMPLGQGLEAREQTAGDCKVAHCDGAGQVVNDNDDNDEPDDEQDCTIDSCLNGEPQYADVNSGEVCDDGDGTLCDGFGNCVECLAPGDCPGQDGECSWRACSEGECGTANAPGSTLLAAQTANDCKKATCAGLVADDNDLPDDSNPCTIDSCNNGTVTYTDEQLGEGCGVNLVCNATGDCVGCNTPNDCPGQDDECKARTCNLNSCGWSNTSQGFAVAAQTADDCREQICDGSGNITWQNDPNDAPVDPDDCSTVTCNNGNPDYSPRNTNYACGQGEYCDGAGSCVQCNSPSQCGTSTDCLTYTCNTHQCGSTNVDAGTVTSIQSPGDCKENQCNGTGGVIMVNNNADLPDDGNQCTIDQCTSGSPSNGPANSGVVCSQNGGTVCDGASSCVECNSGGDCGSGICNNHQCGCTSNDGCASGMCYEGECVTSINGCDIATATLGSTPVSITFANGNFTYAPRCLKVPADTNVTFNGSFSSHNLQGGVISDGVATPASSGPFATVTNTGNTKLLIMNEGGTYPYYCVQHGTTQNMTGVIFVTP